MSTKRLILLIIYGLIITGCLVGVFQSNVTRAEFTIKASIQASTQDEDYVGLLAFKEYVEKNSKKSCPKIDLTKQMKVEMEHTKNRKVLMQHMDLPNPNAHTLIKFILSKSIFL